MTVICPRCKARLRVQEEKLSPAGSRFRCPRCQTVLLVRKPVREIKPINKNLVLVAHSDETVVQRCRDVIEEMGLQSIVARDGIEAMVLAMREHPFVAIIDVALPKIYGFEVARRIKHRKEISDIKVILIASVYDDKRYKREPTSLYGADDYIEEPYIESSLKEKILGRPESPEVKETPVEGSRSEEVSFKEEPVLKEEVRPEAPERDETIERARRLVRTILSDLMLYHPDKVKESIREGRFREEFASQLSEGLKLYNARIPEEVRQKGDFYNEEIDRFIDQIKEKYDL